MGAAWSYTRPALRKKVWGTIAVALLVGLAGAAVLGTLAGARRNDSAYERLVMAEHTGDLTVGTQGVGSVPLAPIRQLPHVVWAERVRGFLLASRPAHGPIVFDRDLGSGLVLASPSPREFYRNDRVQVLEGRLPDPARVDEALANEVFARNHSLEVGDTFRAFVYRLDAVVPIVDRARALGRVPTDVELRPFMAPVDLRITGIGRAHSEVVQNETDNNDTVLATPAFARRYASKAFLGSVSVKLRDPARDTPAFERSVRHLFPELNLSVNATTTEIDTFAGIVGPYSDALRLFALFAAVTALFVVGEALTRLVTSDSTDLETLSALGSTRRQRLLSCSIRAVVALGAGGILAFVGAYALSPLFPIGRARVAEPAPGLRFDAPVLLVGSFVLALVMLVPVVVSAWTRVRRRSPAPAPPSRVATALARAGASIGIVTGARFAVQRDRAANGSSLITTLVGLVAAIAAITGALVFAHNLDGLVTSPSRYGWTWDALIDSYNQQISPDFATRVENDHDVAGVTTGARASLVLGGKAIPVYGFRRIRGDVALATPSGRAPRGAHEIAVGAQTLRDIGKSVGDTLAVPTATGGTIRLKIVGQVLLPSLTVSGTFGVGEGAALDAPALRRFDPSAGPAFFLVNLAPGASIDAVAHRYGSEANTFGARRPGDVVAYGNVRSTPLILAGLLGVLGAGVLAHVLITAIRSRRRDLAILKTLGFTRRQVATTIASLAMTLVGLSLLVGIPLGMVAGRWTWRSFANALGIADVVSTPGLALVALIAVAVGLAMVVAALPARVAARTRPALVLRSE